MLWKLNTNTETRTYILMVLGLGIFACIAACVKSAYRINYGTTTDALWETRNITIWNVAEWNMGIVAGSLPYLRPLFSRLTVSTIRQSATPGDTTAYHKGYKKQSRRRRSRDKWATLSSGCHGHNSEGVIDDDRSQRSLRNTKDFDLNRHELAVYTATVVAAHQNQDKKPTSSCNRHQVQEACVNGITKRTETMVTKSKEEEESKPAAALSRRSSTPLAKTMSCSRTGLFEPTSPYPVGRTKI